MLLLQRKVEFEEQPEIVDIPVLLPHEIFHCLHHAGSVQARTASFLQVSYVSASCVRSVCAVWTLNDGKPQPGRNQTFLGARAQAERVEKPPRAQQPWN